MSKENSTKTINNQVAPATEPIALSLTVKYVSCYRDTDTDTVTSVRIVFNEMFDGYILTSDGEYVRKQINYIAISYSRLLAMLHNISEDIANAISTVVSNDSRQLSGIMSKAKMNIIREEFHEGDSYENILGETLVHEHDGFNTVINSIEVRPEIAKLLDNYATKMLEKALGL